MAYKYNPFTGTLDEVPLITAEVSFPLSFPLGTEALPGIYLGSDNNTGIYSPGADQIAITTAGTGRLFVDSSGVITVPDNGHLKLGTGGDLDLFHNVYDSYIDNNTRDLRIRNIATNCRDLYLQAREDLRFEAGLSEAMRIDSSGRVGIGTTSPDVKLHVEGATAGGAGVEYLDVLQLENTQTANVGATRLKFQRKQTEVVLQVKLQ